MDDHPTPNTNIVTTSIVGGAISIIVVFILNQVLPGVPIEPLVASAFATIASFLVGLMVKPSGGSA